MPARTGALLRPRDADVLRATMRDLRTRTTLPILFGGEVHDDTLLLTEFVGTRTRGLRGLTVLPNSGLGGATVVARRPMAVADYRTAASITHDYDAPVLGEGIRSIIAVPVVVDGSTRAVLYGGQRCSAPIGGRTAEAMVCSARSLADELRVRDEVDRRMRLREHTRAAPAPDPGTEESLRHLHAELRALAAAPEADALRTQLRHLADRMGDVLAGTSVAGEAALSARELDVLAQVAIGCTNAEVAQRLSLAPETVKSYLRSASAKLGTRTRYQAVSAARRAGLIP